MVLIQQEILMKNVNKVEMEISQEVMEINLEVNQEVDQVDLEELKINIQGI